MAAWPLPEFPGRGQGGAGTLLPGVGAADPWTTGLGISLYTGGLLSHTTLDLDMQGAASYRWTRDGPTSNPVPGYDHPLYADYSDLTERLRRVRNAVSPGAPRRPGSSSGGVRAMVGGRDFRHSKFNRATQALRQAGRLSNPSSTPRRWRAGYPRPTSSWMLRWSSPGSGEEWKPPTSPRSSSGQSPSGRASGGRST